MLTPRKIRDKLSSLSGCRDDLEIVTTWLIEFLPISDNASFNHLDPTGMQRLIDTSIVRQAMTLHRQASEAQSDRG